MLKDIFNSIYSVSGTVRAVEFLAEYNTLHAPANFGSEVCKAERMLQSWYSFYLLICNLCIALLSHVVLL